MPAPDTINLSALPRDLLRLSKPVPTDGSGAPPPSNSEIRKIAEDVLGAAKYSIVAVAANPDAPTRPGSLEHDIQRTFQELAPEHLDGYKRRAAALISAPADVRLGMFGRAGERDADSFLGSGGFDRYEEGLAPLAIDTKLLGVRRPTINVPTEALTATSEGLLISRDVLPDRFDRFATDFESASRSAADSAVSAEAMEDIWGSVYEGDPWAGAPAADDFEEMLVTDKMGFWITKIKCVDETNPEWWGSDEIALGAVTIDEDGDTKTVSEKYIGGGFDDGDYKTYGNWRYTWFNMNEGQYWPKSYRVALTLAEKDYGGFASFLSTVWAHVNAKVKAEISKAVTGALTPYLGPVIAKAIGEAVAWVIDLLVGWIISWFKDDIFPVFTASVTTPSMGARWYYPNGTWGNPSSGVRTAHFYGHGGHYYVQYYWKFYA